MAHEVVAKLLEYRQLMKLKSTYTDGLKELVNPETGRPPYHLPPDGYGHGQAVQPEPNLQNIPIRLEMGRLIRKVFIPSRPDNLLLTADYSQIELRILAHVSGDPVLIKASGKVRTFTPGQLRDFRGAPGGGNPGNALPGQGGQFRIIYGLSDFGLARDIKVDRQTARRYIENYFARYAGVKSYIDRVIREARSRGYVTTLLNRRRYLPDLFSPNRIVRNAAERTAMNTPIQGSAADIIKLAMVSIHRELAEHGLKAKMILQVHDELIFDAPENEIEQIAGTG